MLMECVCVFSYSLSAVPMQLLQLVHVMVVPWLMRVYGLRAIMYFLKLHPQKHRAMALECMGFVPPKGCTSEGTA